MNNENKTTLIDLMFKYIIDNKVKILQLLRSTNIFLSRFNYSCSVSLSDVSPVPFLATPQEEADTRIIRHCVYALAQNPVNVIIRSPSADTDIVVLALYLLQEREKIFIENGNGKNRKVFQLSQVGLDEMELNSLIGFHAFSGNDFFHKREKDVLD